MILLRSQPETHWIKGGLFEANNLVLKSTFRIQALALNGLSIPTRKQNLRVFEINTNQVNLVN